MSEPQFLECEPVLVIRREDNTGKHGVFWNGYLMLPKSGRREVGDFAIAKLDEWRKLEHWKNTWPIVVDKKGNRAPDSVVVTVGGRDIRFFAPDVQRGGAFIFEVASKEEAELIVQRGRVSGVLLQIVGPGEGATAKSALSRIQPVQFEGESAAPGHSEVALAKAAEDYEMARQSAVPFREYKVEQTGEMDVEGLAAFAKRHEWPANPRHWSPALFDELHVGEKRNLARLGGFGTNLAGEQFDAMFNALVRAFVERQKPNGVTAPAEKTAGESRGAAK